MRTVSTGMEHERVVAEEQGEFYTCVATSLSTSHHGPANLMRYRPTGTERQRIADGEDLALVILGAQLVPHALCLWEDYHA